MSKYINEKMTEKLNFVVGNKATILVKTIARIFTASPEENWKDSGLLGFLCLVFDRSTKSPYFRLFEIDTCELTFEMELYYNFADSYKNLNGFFYYFEVKNGFIGFSIQDKEDADGLKQKIVNISPKGDPKLLNEQSKANDNGKKNPKKKKGFLKKMWGKITGNSDSDDGYEISGPTDTKHEASIKFDTKKGAFDIKNIPPEWKALFKKAGVEKKHLLDNEYAPMIMEVVLNAFNDQEKAETFANLNSNPASVNSQNTGQSQTSAPSNTKPPQLNSGGGGPPAPVLNLGGGGGGSGPPAPVLNLGGGGGSGPPAPVLNLGGGGGGPPAPVLNLGGGGGGPPAPVLNLGGGGGGPPAPVLNLAGGGGGGPPAPVLNLAGGPSAPALNLAGPSSFKPAANTGAAKGLAKSANLPAPSADRGDLLAQINSGGFKLKKVQKDEKKNVVAVDIKNMPKKVEESLTNTLAAAIAERRKQLMKNNYKEKETSDWSD